MGKTHIQENPKGEFQTCTAGVQPFPALLACMLNGLYMSFWPEETEGRGLFIEACSLMDAHHRIDPVLGEGPQTGPKPFQVLSHLKRATTAVSQSVFQL